MIANPTCGFQPWSGTGDDHEVFVVELIHRDVVDDPALLVAEAGVPDLPRFHVVYFVHGEAAHQAFGSWTLDVDLSHGGEVLHPHVGPDIEVFIHGRGVGTGEEVVTTAFDHLAGGPQVRVIQGSSSLLHQQPPRSMRKNRSPKTRGHTACQPRARPDGTSWHHPTMPRKVCGPPMGIAWILGRLVVRFAPC